MILNRQRTVRVARPPLEAFLVRVREQLRLNGAEITIALVTDKSIAQLNETYRHKKGPTDVLSFPSDAAPRRSGARRGSLVGSSERTPRARRQGVALAVPNKTRKVAAASEEHFLGDIAISPATARRNAKKFGRTLPGELQILILHGVLHLLGYDHETDNGQMTRIENRLRRKLGLQ
jgi:probable rRNA maturation factor